LTREKTGRRAMGGGGLEKEGHIGQTGSPGKSANTPKAQEFFRRIAKHNELEKHGWTSLLWKAGGGYANLQRKEDSKAKGKENAKKEMLWFSPYCLNEEPSLFGDDNKQEEI
jgi:hypothetical protein